MANLRDKLIDRIPSHILESYPRFFDFLEAYYEWLCKDDNPYGAIANHMDYLSLVESVDSYVDHMKQEYLVDVPDRILLDKPLFIKWSKKFNLARGSHASYKFLFKLLFNEQGTSIYLPKENILRTSDGRWVSGETLMMVTHNPNNLEQFQFQRIFQERVIYGDIVERATADVQRVRTKYAGKFVVTELAVANVVGEFLPGYPIESATGSVEWLIPTVSSVDITDGGSGYQRGERVIIQNMTDLEVVRQSEDNGYFDTRISSLYTENDITVLVDGTPISGFEFNGREITSNDISSGDEVTVTFPAYQGYLAVNSTGNNNEVTEIDILDLPISNGGQFPIAGDGIGTGLTGNTNPGVTKDLKGYYSDTKGFLSSNMYLQDSFFYQDYSYSIRTEQDYTAYADIVKDVLHPAGFLMFGQLNIFDTIELLLTYNEETVRALPRQHEVVHKHGLGPNISFFERFKHGLSKRLYNIGHFEKIDMEAAIGQDGYVLQDSKYLGFLDAYNYPNVKGWMHKDNYVDYHNYIPQDYTEETDSGDTYFETGYVSDIVPQ